MSSSNETAREQAAREEAMVKKAMDKLADGVETPLDARIRDIAASFEKDGYLGWRENDLEQLEKMRGFYLDPSSLLHQPATGGCGSDCYPYVVVKVSKSGAKIWLARVEAKAAEGYDYYQHQVHTYDVEGAIAEYKELGEHSTTATRRKHGGYVETGRGDYASVAIGFCRKHQNPHF